MDLVAVSRADLEEILRSSEYEKCDAIVRTAGKNLHTALSGGSLVTLEDARTEVREGRKEGVTCPCCGQFAKVYRRKIHSTMARNLIDAYFKFGTGQQFRPIDEFGKDSPDFIKLQYWGILLEVDPDAVRDDGSNRTGWWMLSSRAAGFVRGITTVTEYALIYNGEQIDTAGDPVSIRDCLGKRFDYDELMDGR